VFHVLESLDIYLQGGYSSCRPSASNESREVSVAYEVARRDICLTLINLSCGR
jgi:hypothetical protein